MLLLQVISNALVRAESRHSFRKQGNNVQAAFVNDMSHCKAETTGEMYRTFPGREHRAVLSPFLSVHSAHLGGLPRRACSGGHVGVNMSGHRCNLSPLSVLSFCLSLSFFVFLYFSFFFFLLLCFYLFFCLLFSFMYFLSFSIFFIFLSFSLFIFIFLSLCIVIYVSFFFFIQYF